MPEEQGARDEANELVRRHVDLVGQVLTRVSLRFPRHVDREELWNAGALGLVEASRRFDPDLGLPFPRYAAVRIRGAIIDATRTRDWVTRSVRRGLRELEETKMAFAKCEGRTPGRAELAAVLGITEEDVAVRQAEAASSLLLYLDHSGDGDDLGIKDQLEDEDDSGRPDAALTRRELIGALREAVSELPGVHGEVVRRYYLGGELLRQIAADLDVTVARVSQIRSEGLAALRLHFANLYEGVPEVAESAPGKRARHAYAAALAARSTWRSRIAAADAPFAMTADTS